MLCCCPMRDGPRLQCHQARRLSRLGKAACPFDGTALAALGPFQLFPAYRALHPPPPSQLQDPPAITNSASRYLLEEDSTELDYPETDRPHRRCPLASVPSTWRWCCPSPRRPNASSPDARQHPRQPFSDSEAMIEAGHRLPSTDALPAPPLPGMSLK